MEYSNRKYEDVKTLIRMNFDLLPIEEQQELLSDLVIRSRIKLVALYFPEVKEK